MLRSRFGEHPCWQAGKRAVGLQNDCHFDVVRDETPFDDDGFTELRMVRVVDLGFRRVFAGSMPCDREAAALLSDCPFSYISVPPWFVASKVCRRPSYQARRSRPKNGRFGRTAGSTGVAVLEPGWERGTGCSGFECAEHLAQKRPHTGH